MRCPTHVLTMISHDEKKKPHTETAIATTTSDPGSSMTAAIARAMASGPTTERRAKARSTTRPTRMLPTNPPTPNSASSSTIVPAPTSGMRSSDRRT